MSQNPQTYAHGVQHTRPIVARGVHTNAANDAEAHAAIVRREREEQLRAFFARQQQEGGYQSECTKCGGTKSGRHAWHGFVGVCTCGVKS